MENAFKYLDQIKISQLQSIIIVLVFCEAILLILGQKRLAAFRALLIVHLTTPNSQTVV